MNVPAYGDDAPIAALATAPAGSALAVIRTSGKNALALIASVFSRPEKLAEAPGNSVVLGWILKPAGQPGKAPAEPEKIDEVLVSVFRSPRSFTGEDCGDISCHGGAVAARAIMAALSGAGFREALPGEFSFRAFMNGKLDLTRAESVMELVSAKTDRSRERAVRRLSGALEGEIREIKSLLVQVLAGTELLLDYSEDELDAPPPGLPERPLAEEALKRLRALAASYRVERLYQDGALAVIAGRPNAGKSSLFNRLLREDRSIVTDIPGTTRDWIEAWTSVEGIPVRLADTAGLHTPGDAVEKIGVERSRELLEEADLALYVIDGTEGVTGEDRRFLADLARTREGAPVIAVWNKADAAPETGRISAGESGGIPKPPGLLPVSAKTGAGIPELGAAVARALESARGGTGPGGAPGAADGTAPEPAAAMPAGIGTVRQKELIGAALGAVEEALALADRGEALDLTAPLLREGINSLGEITGEVSAADILEVMFSRFCVGK
jgi:tRNA modification GTPase